MSITFKILMGLQVAILISASLAFWGSAVYLLFHPYLIGAFFGYVVNGFKGV